MSVVFVIGRAGTGKTAYCLRKVSQSLAAEPLGPPIWLIVPRHSTLTVERLLACHSGLSGFCRARVLSFDRLGADLLAACDDDGLPELPTLQRRMLLSIILRRCADRLRFYGPAAGRPGLAARLDAALGELDPWGRGPQSVADAIHRLPCREETAQFRNTLADKLHDLHLVYAEFHRVISGRWRDTRQRASRAVEAIGRCAQARDAEAYVDGHLCFTAQERRLLVELARTCRRTHIALLMDPHSPVLARNGTPDELSVFHPPERTYLRLREALAEAGVDIEPPVLLEKPRRFASTALAAVERLCPGDSAQASDAPADEVELAEAPDRRAEVEHAARRARDLVCRGKRMRDIAVVVRNLEQYHDLIAAAFREHGLRCFIDRPRPLSHHPLVRLVRAVLQTLTHGWEHTAVMTLVKTGLAGLSDEEAARLENYVLAHGLPATAWTQETPWSEPQCPQDAPGEDDQPPAAPPAPGADALRRRVFDAVAPLAALLARDGGFTGAEAARAIYATLERMRVREVLAEWIRRDRPARRSGEATEHEQAWEQLAALLDQLAALPDDMPLSPAELVQIVDAGLDEFSLAMAPPTVDEVFVGQIDRSHIPEAAAVIVLGLNEGEFPRSGSEGAMLNDGERARLLRAGLELDEGSRRRLLDERLLGYIALTRASQRLYVSRSLCDEAGRPQAPSPLWTGLRRILPRAAVRQLPRDLSAEPHLISTPRHLVGWLMERARSLAADELSRLPAWAALYQWLAGGGTGERQFAAARDAWRALSYANDAAIGAELAQRLFPDPLTVSPSRMETFAACPFKHFAAYGLGLRPRAQARSCCVPMGAASHMAADRLMRRLRSLPGGAPAEDELRAFVDEALENAQRILRQESLPEGRMRHERQRIVRLTEDLLRWQRAVTHRSALRPALGRTCFGTPGAKLPPLELTTPRGRRLRITGCIDRVDLLEDAEALVAIDYRLGSGKLELCWAYHALAVELLVYLLLLREHGKQLADAGAARPAGAFHLALLRGLRKCDDPDEEPAPTSEEYVRSARPRGIFIAEHLQSLDRQLKPGDWSAIVQARINKDGSPGNRDKSDAVNEDELEGLLSHTRTQLAQLADRMADGDIQVRPFYIRGETPCPACPYRAVCRFDLSVDRYRVLARMSRLAVLDAVRGRSEEDAHA